MMVIKTIEHKTRIAIKIVGEKSIEIKSKTQDTKTIPHRKCGVFFSVSIDRAKVEHGDIVTEEVEKREVRKLKNEFPAAKRTGYRLHYSLSLLAGRLVEVLFEYRLSTSSSDMMELTDAAEPRCMRPTRE